MASLIGRHLGRDASLTCSVGAIIMILELLFVAAAQAAASPEGCEAESGEFVTNRATAGAPLKEGLTFCAPTSGLHVGSIGHRPGQILLPEHALPDEFVHGARVE